MSYKIIASLFSGFFLSTAPSRAQEFYSTPFAHTFSIVARDSVTGEMGVGVQSHWFSVGTLVAWAEAGVGAIATQSLVNPAFGPLGLQLLKNGKTPEEVVQILTAADSGRDVRQLAVIDTRGAAASYTGKNCIKPAGNIAERNFSVQANLMMNDQVWPAMAKAFKQSKGPLAERMIAALEAGQEAGGDIRGKQSASLLVVKSKSTGKLWEDRSIDLRVDDHLEPIVELKRLLHVFRAYEHMNAGDVAIEKNDMALAEKEYTTAEKMFPENPEMKFWYAVTLINKKKPEEALPLFADVFSRDENWRVLVPRLRTAGLLNCTDEIENRILLLNK
jgi:uncharacterized Ntn-hydrolase superfamily protein